MVNDKMVNSKTTVVLTGATGTMGYAGMTEILRYPDRYELRILARPSQKNKALLTPIFAQHASFLHACHPSHHAACG